MYDIIFSVAVVYLFFISIAALFVTVSDKNRAIKKQRRISEKTLFCVALLGGSAVMFLTMLTIRHKTKHLNFMLGLPLISFLQCVILLWLLIA